VKAKIIFGLLPLAVLVGVGAVNRDYIVKMIECSPVQERGVASGYDCFMTLLSDGKIAAGRLQLSATQVQRRAGNLIFERAYYISPNELRGFVFAVPEALTEERDGIIRNKTGLRLANREMHQGLQTCVLAGLE
jgi:hypothetical protein